MTYPPQQPEQPGGWSDPSWPSQQPQQPPPGGNPYDPTPQQPYGSPATPPPAYGPPGTPQPYGAEPPYSGAQPAAPYGGYGYPGYGQPAANQPTNGLAIASLVCSLVGIATCISAPVGAILGHIARRQIRERGEGGDGMAKAGIIIGWILTGLGVVGCAFYVAVVVWAIGQDPSTTGN